MIIHGDTQTLAKKAVQIIKDFSDNKEITVLGIPGGRSIKEIFNLFRTANIDWKKIQLFWVDDRLVDHKDKDSNYKLAYDSFIKDLIKDNKIPQKNIHPFNLDIRSKDKGTKAYTEELNKFGGFDIVLFGVGEDGHVGALYPDHHSVKDTTDQFITMQDSPKPPPYRMTGSKRLFMQAKVAIALFLGEAKSDAFKIFKDSKTSIADCPAKLIKSIKHNYAFTDLK
ncbi:MAG: 6-phosphogluconolactonase [Nanoarchaeota archaeon]|nr:6-phosphogluconolactonase [Nanoarchaeota archaeon]MBU1703842.1 6-phosphogluconolactonase [Nanoarchaeota archaeon]